MLSDGLVEALAARGAGPGACGEGEGMGEFDRGREDVLAFLSGVAEEVLGVGAAVKRREEEKVIKGESGSSVTSYASALRGGNQKQEQQVRGRVLVINVFLASWRVVQGLEILPWLPSLRLFFYDCSSKATRALSSL